MKRPNILVKESTSGFLKNLFLKYVQAEKIYVEFSTDSLSDSVLVELAKELAESYQGMRSEIGALLQKMPDSAHTLSKESFLLLTNRDRKDSNETTSTSPFAVIERIQQNEKNIFEYLQKALISNRIPDDIIQILDRHAKSNLRNLQRVERIRTVEL
ncbi:MAG: hypothetical protein AAFO91_00830 [Bacteroidota bacterium]